MAAARLCLALVAFVTLIASAKAVLPVVLWHGMGDTCWCGQVLRTECLIPLATLYPWAQLQTYFKRISLDLEIGSTIEEDERNGFFMVVRSLVEHSDVSQNVNSQIEYAWKVLSADPKLAGGFNAIGFSQGGQFLRAYVQRYNNPPVRNLISVGGQHQGVFGFPRCMGNNSEICNEVRKLLNLGVYLSFVQDGLVQAEYWQDPLNEDEYINKSIFLADINNARPEKNATYKANLLTLDTFVMVMFLNDTMVQPKQSEWFGWFGPGQDVDTIPLQQTQIYTEDWLGLQQLDQHNKLHFISTIGEHLQFTQIWFIDNIIQPYLQTNSTASAPSRSLRSPYVSSAGG